MANAVTLISKYLPYLDQVYKQGSKTTVLDMASNLVRDTADAKTVLIPKLSLTGLANYSRNTGYTAGSETLTWESKTFSYDRGTKFNVDAMDDQESMGAAFGFLASEFIRTKVAPEMDAIRFAKYAAEATNSSTTALTASNIDAQIIAGETAIANAEADLANCVLFVNPTVLGLIKQSSNYSRNLAQGENINHALAAYDEMQVVVVPQSRFYSAITLYDGTTSGQTDGGYIKNATTGVDLNFIIVSRDAVAQIVKRYITNVFEPGVNQGADGYLVNFRNYHDAWVLDNKNSGIYVSKMAE